jgi:hypothetical protein
MPPLTREEILAAARAAPEQAASTSGLAAALEGLASTRGLADAFIKAASRSSEICAAMLRRQGQIASPQAELRRQLDQRFAPRGQAELFGQAPEVEPVIITLLEQLLARQAEQRGRKPGGDPHAHQELYRALLRLDRKGQVSYAHGGLRATAERLRALFPDYKLKTIEKIITPWHARLKAQRAPTP